MNSLELFVVASVGRGSTAAGFSWIWFFCVLIETHRDIFCLFLVV